jgi:hypothetical protein
LVDGDFAAGRDWALRSVRVNRAHFLVIMTTILSCSLAGDRAEAARWALHLRTQRPEATVAAYLRTLHFADESLRGTVRATLLGLGMAE